MGILKAIPTYGSASSTPPGSIKSVGVQEGKDTADFPRAIIDLMDNAICTALESLDGIGT